VQGTLLTGISSQRLRQAQYSPDGKRLVVVAALASRAPYTAAVIELASGEWSNMIEYLPPEQSHQILSAHWVTSTGLICTHLWQTDELKQAAQATGIDEYLVGWTMVDLDGAVTPVGNSGVLLKNLKYSLVGATDANHILVAPAQRATYPVDPPDCLLFSFEAAGQLAGDCIASGDTHLVAWSFSRPWVMFREGNGAFGPQPVLFRNTLTGESVTVPDVPLVAVSPTALITEDGRFVLCAASGPGTCGASPIIIDTATNTRHFVNDDWSPVALSAAANALLVQRCKQEGQAWEYESLLLEDVLP